MNPRPAGIYDIMRYARGASPIEVVLDGYPNYHYLTSPPDREAPRLMLERGINPTASVLGPDGPRRPLIAIRSSPWKAGHTSNPWHDEFDLDHGHIRYYGDHKSSTVGLPGATSGNRALLEAWSLHAGTIERERALAPPLLVFRSITVNDGGRRIVKGHVEFCGVAVIERLEHVVQRDPTTGRSFPNLVLDLAVLDLAVAGDTLDMRWIDDRRDADLTVTQTARYAPESWKRWVAQGRAAIPRVRRRVISSRVKTTEEQLPIAGSVEERLLQQLYRFFDARKHAFEMLASRIAAQILGGSGAVYRDGWLTRAGGDGGVDFVGRLDVGSPTSNTPLVVLGQAKCVAPRSSVGPDQVARVVARLRRGWIGAFVTTGVFSRQAQVEIIDDQYPLVLVNGRVLVEQVVRMAAADHGGDVDALLRSIVGEYESAVTHRRPEEILCG
ncbi:restriction endonuclease [Micromonospora sp. NPDC048898]|uniref:restriction endonuclease n=1 Tax=Micromonospora sp. NPDC048898 TaxID=3364260 RepID=UPI00371E3638